MINFCGNLARIRRTVFLAITAGALVLSGCATTSGVPVSQMTAQQRLMYERSQAMERTVWQGCGTGLLLGAAVAALRNGDTESILFSAAGGCIAGAALGQYLGSTQQQYASTERQIESVTADVRAKNGDAEQLIEITELVLIEHRASLAHLNGQYEAGLVDEAARRQQMASIANTERILSDSIETTENQLAVFQEARTYYATNLNEGEKGLSEMDAELAQLSAHTNRLVALNDELAATRGV